MPSTDTGDGAEAEPTATKKARKPTFEEEVRAMYQMAAGGLGMAALFMGSQKLAVDADILAQHAEPRARELVNVANHHPQLKKAIQAFMHGSDMMALVMGHGMLAMAIANNHGLTVQVVGNAARKAMGRPTKTAEQMQTEAKARFDGAVAEERAAADEVADILAMMQGQPDGFGIPPEVAEGA